MKHFAFRRAVGVCFLLSLGGVAIAFAQANINMPSATIAASQGEPAKGASAEPTNVQPGKKNPSSGCQPRMTVAPDGTLVFKDCSGKAVQVKHPEAQASTDASAETDTPLMDPATAAKQQEAVRAAFEYQAYSYRHAQQTFEFQYWSGKVIFAMVLLIVLAGLAFSAIQFYVGIKHPLDSRAKTDGSSASDDPSVSEFEASLQGIKLKSSVLGLLILAMSMVFFYVYIKFVYPITNVSH